MLQGKLTFAKCRELAKPGLYSDGGTLYLRVAPGGSKQWVQRLMIRGKVRDLGLGGFPLVPLADAREAALANRRVARSGGDPLADKRKAVAPTFAEAAAKAHEAERQARGWKNAAHAAQWIRTLESYAFPMLGSLPVNEIRAENVLRVLTPIWTAKPETARRVRQRIEAVISWAQSAGYFPLDTANPAGNEIARVLPKQARKKGHHKALPFREIGAAWEAIGAYPGQAARLFVQFVILTACRSGEARLATWAEIDLEARTWTIPAERMKAGREHRVPLSDSAVAVLREAEAIRGAGDLLFPSPAKAGPLSNAAAKKVLTKSALAERTTPHGFRSTFRDWCGESGVRRQDAEAALAHTVQGVEGAYFRSDLFERRRRVMAKWAAFVSGQTADVVELKRSA